MLRGRDGAGGRWPGRQAGRTADQRSREDGRPTSDYGRSARRRAVWGRLGGLEPRTRGRSHTNRPDKPEQPEQTGADRSRSEGPGGSRAADKTGAKNNRGGASTRGQTRERCAGPGSSAPPGFLRPTTALGRRTFALLPTLRCSPVGNPFPFVGLPTWPSPSERPSPSGCCSDGQDFDEAQSQPGALLGCSSVARRCLGLNRRQRSENAPLPPPGGDCGWRRGRAAPGSIAAARSDGRSGGSVAPERAGEAMGHPRRMGRSGFASGSGQGRTCPRECEQAH
jgi:hypothetical protein